ncbi:MAG: hypothetical protein OEV61_08260 [Chloroflexota bacterium]|jgi:hypothetical protein|nr:hypothetical protein [Chloroflexota bacterium]
MRRLVLATVMTVLLGACGNATPVQVGSMATATSSPSPDIRPSATSSAPARLYPYSLPWPVDLVESDWRFATAAWDGTARIDHGNRYTDSAETRDGSLFAFGFPMTGGPEDLRDLVAEQAQAWHGCQPEPSAEEPVEGGVADGILGVYACGVTPVLRWVGVHEGFGLFVGLIVAPGSDVDEVEARFREHLAGLEWTG